MRKYISFTQNGNRFPDDTEMYFLFAVGNLLPTKNINVESCKDMQWCYRVLEVHSVGFQPSVVAKACFLFCRFISSKQLIYHMQLHIIN